MNIKYLVIFILTVITLTSFPINMVRAGLVLAGSVLYVDPTGATCPGAYTSVSSALAFASSGDRIVLCANVTESIGLVSIDGLEVTIDGYYNGEYHNWTVNDTDSTNPAINIINNADVTFANITIILDNKTTPSPNSGIYITDSNMTLYNSSLKSYVDYGPAINVDGSSPIHELNIQNSSIFANYYALNITLFSDDELSLVLNNTDIDADYDALYLYIYDSSNASVFIYDSDVDGDDDGIYVDYVDYYSNLYMWIEGTDIDADYYALYLYLYDSSNASVSIYNSYLYSWYSDGIYVDYVEYYSNLYMWIENTEIDADEDGLYLYIYDDSNASVYIHDSDIYSYDDGIYVDYVDYYSNLYMWIEGTDIDADYYALYLDIEDYSNASVFIYDSDLYSWYSDGIYVDYVEYDSNLTMWIEDTYIDADDDGLYLYIYDSSNASVFIYDSDLYSYDDGIYVDYVECDSSLTMWIEDTYIDADEDALYLDIEDYSNASVFIYDSDLYSYDDDGIDVDYVWYDSNLTMWIEDTYIDADDNALYLDIYDNSNVSVFIYNSDLYSWYYEGIDVDEVDYNSNLTMWIEDTYIYADDDDGIYVDDVTDNSNLYMWIEDTYIDADYDALDYYIDSSDAELYVFNSFLYGDDNGLEISSYSSSTFYGRIEYSYLGEFDISGSGVTLDLIETVYDEVDSYTDSNTVYSEWTLLIQVINEFNGRPLQGVSIDVVLGGTPIATLVTGSNGIATYTFSYYYDESSPLITQLSLNASVLDRFKYVAYTDIEPELTLPMWYGNITIYFRIFWVEASVAGNLGFGTVNINGEYGEIIVGAMGGWMNHYPVKVDRVIMARNYVVAYIKVFYEGNWVRGYLLIDRNAKTLYLIAGPIRLYGALTG